MATRAHIPLHKLHPAQLATDWIFGALSLIPFWNHQPLFGLIVAFGPSFLILYVLRAYISSTMYMRSDFGRYMTAHMNSWLQTMRFVGFVSMILGSWYHDVLVIAFGLSLILLSWLNGIFLAALRTYTAFSIRIPQRQRYSVPHNLPR